MSKELEGFSGLSVAETQQQSLHYTDGLSFGAPD